jgi:branched-chain amino acid transport system substrate-binding protein
MKNKKTLLIITAIVVIIGLIIGINIYQSSKEPEVIKIGAILPLTGEGSFWGNNAKKGIELSLEEINSSSNKNNKYKIEVIYEDSHTNAKSAISALQKLISQYKIQCSIVDMISSNVLAMAPIANANKVVIISPGASAREITNAGPFVFRNWPSDALQGKINAIFALNELKWKKIAIIYVLNAYGEGLKDEFTNYFEKGGGKIILTEGINQGATNIRNQILKIYNLYKNKSIDGVYLAIYPTEHPIFLKQSKEIGLKIPILATESFDNPKIISLPESEGVVYSVPAEADTTRSVVKNFRDNFRKKFQEEPGITADAAYDALKLLTLCINKVGNNGEKIRNCLIGIKNYEGASGLITFDENGDITKPFIYKIVKSGKAEKFTDKIFY